MRVTVAKSPSTAIARSACEDPIVIRISEPNLQVISVIVKLIYNLTD
jgi:hypothetical protein